MLSMDRLTEHDLALSRETPPAAKLQQALQLMATGIRLRRAALRRESPESPASEIQRRLEAWLSTDG